MAKENEIFSIIKRIFRRNANISKKDRNNFLRYFFIIAFICLVLISVFALFFAKNLLKVDSQNRLSIYNIYLESYMNSADYTIAMCTENVIKEVNTSNALIAVMFKEDASKILSTATNRAVSDLKSISNTNTVFSDILLFVHSSDLCLSSNGTNTLMENTSDKYVKTVQAYSDKNGRSIKQGNFEAYFVKTAYGYVICYDMLVFEGRPTSTLFMFLDDAILYSYLKDIYNSDFGMLDICVFDSDGNLIHGAPSTETREIVELSANSEILDWTYKMYVPEVAVTPTSTQYIPQILLLVVLLIITFILLSLFAAAYLYRPLFRVSEALKGNEITEGTDLGQEVSQMTFALQEVASDVTNNLFKELLNGSPKELNSVQNLLIGIKSPFQINSLYLVLSVKHDGNPEQILLQLKKTMLSIDELYNTTSTSVEMNRETIAIVLQFNKLNISIADSKKTLNLILTNISDRLQKCDISYAISNGPLYHSIMDIGFSYSQATSEEKMENEENLSPKLHRIVSWFAGENIEAANQALDKILASNENKTKVISLLRDEMLAYEFIDSSEIAQEGCTAAELIESFIAQVTKRKNPYITKTREYIDEHYQDYNLSLVTIAGEIGVSPSYLSRLFSERMGIKLIEYISSNRLDKSMNLLIKTNKPISEIASQCGFVSSRNYIAAFKRRFNTTPGDYRTKTRNS